MTASTPLKPIRSWPSSQNIPNQAEATSKVLSPTTAQWCFEKEAGQSALDLASKLQIHHQLSHVGAPVQKLLTYGHFEEGSKHVVRAEFETITDRLLPTWRHVNECLDAMISCFFSLTEIHANNVYHGNPCIDNFIFQNANHAESGIRTTKGYLTNFRDCGHINGDPDLSAKDVQIALSDFGGRLLLIAENSGYTKIRVLRIHLESQVNFADQDDLDALESASTIHSHLCTLKNLLNLRKKDYPINHRPAWGPLKQKQLEKEYLELQQKRQSKLLDSRTLSNFKLPLSLEVRNGRLVALSDIKRKASPVEQTKARFYRAKATGLAIFTAGAMMAFLSIRARQINKK